MTDFSSLSFTQTREIPTLLYLKSVNGTLFGLSLFVEAIIGSKFPPFVKHLAARKKQKKLVV